MTTCHLQRDQTLPLSAKEVACKTNKIIKQWWIIILTTISITPWTSCNLHITPSLNFRRLRVIALPCSSASCDFTSSREISGGRSCKNGSERSWAVRSFTFRRASTWESSGFVELSARASDEGSADFDSHSILLCCQFSKPWLHHSMYTTLPYGVTFGEGNTGERGELLTKPKRVKRFPEVIYLQLTFDRAVKANSWRHKQSTYLYTQPQECCLYKLSVLCGTETASTGVWELLLSTESLQKCRRERSKKG